MTPLRQKMIAALELNGKSPSTPSTHQRALFARLVQWNG